MTMAHSQLHGFLYHYDAEPPCKRGSCEEFFRISLRSVDEGHGVRTDSERLSRLSSVGHCERMDSYKPPRVDEPASRSDIELIIRKAIEHQTTRQKN